MKTVLCWLPPTGTFLLQTMLQLIVGHMKSTLTDFSLIAIALLQGICQALQKTALSCTQCTDDSEARVWIFCLVFWAFFYNNLVCDVYLQGTLQVFICNSTLQLFHETRGFTLKCYFQLFILTSKD